MVCAYVLFMIKHLNWDISHWMTKFRICVEKRNDHRQIFKEYIARYIGMTISKGQVEPDREALAEHRKRNNISNSSN